MITLNKVSQTDKYICVVCSLKYVEIGKGQIGCKYFILGTEEGNNKRGVYESCISSCGDVFTTVNTTNMCS